MRFTTYSKYHPELADAVNLQGLLDQLTDFLLQSGFVQTWEQQTVDGGGYLRLDPTRKLEKCRWQSVIEVYQRLKP